MQKLIVMQSLWAMERRQPDGMERPLEKNVEMIIEAGYGGVSTDWRDRERSKRIAAMLKPHGMVAEGQCFPKTVDELKPVLEIATETGLHHLDIQPDVRPRSIAECVPLIEGWLRLAEQVDFPVYIETHRDRMTTDLFFVLDLLDRFVQCLGQYDLLGEDVRPRLVTDAQRVTEALGRDQQGAVALAFEQRIGGDRRAHAHLADGTRRDRLPRPQPDMVADPLDRRIAIGAGILGKELPGMEIA